MRDMPIPLVFVMVIAVVALLIFQRMKLKQSIAQNQDKNFGAVADRLGMQVEAGDPNTNLLYFMEKMGNYERELRATGKPYGHMASLKVIDSLKKQDFVAFRRVTRSYGCFLQLKLQQQVAPFEVVLRNPNQYLIPTQELQGRDELRDAPSGNAAIDAQFVIRSADARTAAALVPALQILSQQLFVHLAGEGDDLWINVTRMGLPYFAHAVEEYMLAVETAACGIEGQPLPAHIAIAAPTKALTQ
jgi:hypothetical protein